jgi:hypothetical protein
VNPYQSPSSPLDPPSTTSAKRPARGRELVFTSLILAVLIEVLPTEVDWTAVALHAQNDIRLFVQAKAICLALILAPLLLYLWINGRHGIKVVKGRIVAIGVIVGVRLAMDACMLVAWLRRA